MPISTTLSNDDVAEGTVCELVSLNDDEIADKNETPTKLYQTRIPEVKTLALYLTFFGQGLTAGILGPSLPDFQLQVAASLKWVSFIFTARSIGNLIGTVVSGFVYDRVETSLVLIMSLLVMSVVGFGLPHLNSVVMLAIAMGLWGITAGFNNTGCNVWCMKIWGNKSNPYMQALHFSFALGATISPLITSPFLSPTNGEHVLSNGSAKMESNLSSEMYLFDRIQNESQTLTPQFWIVSPSTNLDIEYNEINISIHHTQNINFTSSIHNIESISRGQLWIPYTIVSVYIMLVSVFVVCLRSYLVSRGLSHEDFTKKEKEEEAEPEVGEKSNPIVIIILLAVFFFVYAPLEIVYGSFLYVYAVEGYANFTPEMASYLNSTFWGTFAAVRCISICCAVRLASRTMLIIDIIGLCFASSLLAIFTRNTIVLWIGTILLGASMASLYPSALSWANLYIRVTGKITSFFLFVTAASMMIFPWGVGALFDEVGVFCLIYVTLAACLCTATVYVCMQCVATKYGRRKGDASSKTIALYGDDETHPPTTLAE